MPLRRTPVFTGASEEPEFEVDKVVAKRLGSRNRVEYLVHWKGYIPFDATWEPAENLVNAPEAVRQFER